MAKKPKPLPSHIPIFQAHIDVHFSDGEGFSCPSKYRGYWLSYHGYNPLTGDMGLMQTQRILPGITERSAENDEKATKIFMEIEKVIQQGFDKSYEKSYGAKRNVNA